MLIAENLISSVKMRSMAPVSQRTFTEPQILQIVNEEAMIMVTPMVLAARENFFLTYKRVAITANKSRYTLPSRAIGNALKDIWWIDSSGNRTRTVPRTDVHDIKSYTSNGTGPAELLLMGDEVMIFPTPTQSGGYLEMWFYRRPNDVKLTTECTKITAVSSAGGTTTLTVNTDLTTDLAIGDRIDFLSAASPYLLWAYDVAITAISSTQIQVATSDISDEASSVEPVVGDYICPAGYANIPNFPDEYHPILAQVGAIKLLESLGDLEKMAAAQAKLEKMIQNGFKTIVNRVESEVEPIMSRGGILNSI